MSDAAGKVQIVLSVDKATYSQAMAEAQRQLDQFAGKAKGAGAAHVSSMQASSASIRMLEGDWSRQTRTVEKFIATIPGVSQALKVAFPVLGGIAFGAMVFELGSKVADFIQKARQMPQAITQGFEALSLSQRTSTDSLNVMTDKLNDAHAAFEHKPVNALKTAADEAREATDKLAESAIAANEKVTELLSKNHLSMLQGWTVGQAGTGPTEKAWKDYQQSINHQEYMLSLAAPGSKQESDIRNTIQSLRSGYMGKVQSRLSQENAIDAANGPKDQEYASERAMMEGILSVLNNQISGETATTANAAAQKQKDEDDAKKKVAQDAKQAAQQRLQAMTEGLNALKLQRDVDVRFEYDYWDARRNAFAKGSEQYNAIVQKQAELAVSAARSAHEAIAKFRESQKRDSAELAPGIVDPFAKQRGQDWIQSNVDAQTGYIDYAQNKARGQESAIAEQAGKSISHLAAAMELAAVHTEEYSTTVDALKKLVGIRESQAKNDPTAENLKQLAEAQKALADYQSKRNVQVSQDNAAVNGIGTSGLVGAKDALDEFVTASRDAATQMRELVSNTLHSLNEQIVAAMMGRRTSFGQMGSDMFRSIANTGLQSAEGSILRAFGFGKGGKLGTSSNPMYVKMVSTGESIAKSITGAASGTAGKVGGVLGGIVKAVLPGFASGGYMDGPALVGENGPEILNTKGYVTPNYKLSAIGGGGDIHFHPGAIDARGATDPAAVDAAVRRGITEAAPQLMAGSVHAMNEQRKRRPMRSAV